MEAAAQTLVLDPGYQVVEVTGWQEAVSLWFQGKARIVEEYDQVVSSAYMTIRVPAVVVLIRNIRRYRKPVKFSRVNVYGRDGYRCQYCNDKLTMSELTYDHVVPRSQGGRTEWDNIVTCCCECNARKGGRTPAQAKMRLLRKPVQPVDVPQVALQITRDNAPEAWRDYIYWAGALDA